VASINEPYYKTPEKFSCSEVLGRASDSPDPPSRTGKGIRPVVVGVQGATTDVERCNVEADSSIGHIPNKNENDGTNIYSVHRNVTSQYAVIHLKSMRAVHWTSAASCSTRKVKAKIRLPHHRRSWIVIIFTIITIIIIFIIIQVLFTLRLFNDAFHISDKTALNDRQR